MTTFTERTIDLMEGDVILRDGVQVEVEEVQPLGAKPYPSVRVRGMRPGGGPCEFITGASRPQEVVGE